MQKNILALQFGSDLNSKNLNFKQVENLFEGFLKKNPNSKPDILFLPEVWNCGWFCEDFLKKAEDETGETINFLTNFAKKHSINIIGGSYIRKTPTGLKNSCPVINRRGELICHYDKIHLFSPDGEAKDVQRGETAIMVELEGLKIGLSICFDIRFPELFRSFIEQNLNPHLFVNLSAWPKTRVHHYEVLTSARAIENQAYFLGLSQSGLIKNNVYNAGNSLLISPFGEIIQKLNENEGYIFQTINTNEVEKIRENFPNLKEIKTDNYKIETIHI